MQLPFSDGQVVSVVFHSPEGDKKRIGPQDTIIAFRWLLNKRDITQLVSPEDGAEVALETIAKRICQLLIKNSARFEATQKEAMAEKKELDNLNEKIEEAGERQLELIGKGESARKELESVDAEISNLTTLNQKLRADIAELEAKIAALRKAEAGTDESQRAVPEAAELNEIKDTETRERYAQLKAWGARVQSFGEYANELEKSGDSKSITFMKARLKELRRGLKEIKEVSPLAGVSEFHYRANKYGYGIDPGDDYDHDIKLLRKKIIENLEYQIASLKYDLGKDAWYRYHFGFESHLKDAIKIYGSALGKGESPNKGIGANTAEEWEQELMRMTAHLPGRDDEFEKQFAEILETIRGLLNKGLIPYTPNEYSKAIISLVPDPLVPQFYKGYLEYLKNLEELAAAREAKDLPLVAGLESRAIVASANDAPNSEAAPKRNSLLDRFLAGEFTQERPLKFASVFHKVLDMTSGDLEILKDALHKFVDWNFDNGNVGQGIMESANHPPFSQVSPNALQQLMSFFQSGIKGVITITQA